jgi:stage II sporulation protein P
MFQRKEVVSIGIFALVVALLLRMAGYVGILPLQNGDMLSLLVYLQTGRVVRYPGTPAPERPPAALPTVPPPSSAPATTQPPPTTSAPPVTSVPPATTALPPTQPLPPPPVSLQLTAEDAHAVRLNDLVDYDPDIEALLLSPLDWDLTADGPAVLILHTHATESYTQQPEEIYQESSAYRTLDAAYNMLSIGEELAAVLTAGGIQVLHDLTLHDHPSYSGSYDYARQTIAAYLDAYPSIRMVIDLHRDALDFNTDPQLTTLATVNGSRSAQLMLVAGTDRNLAYPGWADNLALGVKLTAVLENMYPGITRPILLRSQRFNLDMTPGSILVEVGANGNTHQEALTAVRALGEAILVMANGVNLQDAPPL